MNVGIIGLGRIGSGIAYRLKNAGYTVIGYDPASTAVQTATELGIQCVYSLQELAHNTRIIWLLVPAGNVVDQTIQALLPYMLKNDILIDGGNSHFKDSQRNANMLQQKEVFFLDCGTSGGVHGKKEGFCLMIGGDRHAYDIVTPLFAAIATNNGYAYMGNSGAGHYVKMVHNGIEYALLQAYAEGFQLIKEGTFKNEALDLKAIAHVWNHGSIIRSWILSLIHLIFQEQVQNLSTISGKVDDNGTGRWTVEEAQLHHISLRIIEDALTIRSESQKTGGSYATKLVALLRNKFGGHTVQKI